MRGAGISRGMIKRELPHLAALVLLPLLALVTPLRPVATVSLIAALLTGVGWYWRCRGTRARSYPSAGRADSAVVSAPRSASGAMVARTVKGSGSGSCQSQRGSNQKPGSAERW